jgi:hypothetical protein
VIEAHKVLREYDSHQRQAVGVVEEVEEHVRGQETEEQGLGVLELLLEEDECDV